MTKMTSIAALIDNVEILGAQLLILIFGVLPLDGALCLVPCVCALISMIV
jgi:hypothetical protein